MNTYAILFNPGHNRVYFDSSRKLAFYELSILLKSSGYEFFNIKEESISDIFYLTFETVEELTDELLGNLSRLSFLYALFKLEKVNERTCLFPVSLNDIKYINSSISSILKYTGKTNEIFTRMLLNIAYFSSDFVGKEINILDPIAGKGTTLYESLIFGHNAYGIEISDKVTLEAYTFIKKYLELEKYKHTTKKEVLKSLNKASRYTVEIAKTKEDVKSKKIKTWSMISANSKDADKLFKKNYFQLIVGDLPYGVQHGNVANSKVSGLTRSPRELLENCASSWYNVLQKNGILALSWNSFLLKRSDFAKILVDKGFTILEGEDYINLEHRVDQAIKRDIIVAKKN